MEINDTLEKFFGNLIWLFMGNMGRSDGGAYACRPPSQSENEEALRNALSPSLCRLSRMLKFGHVINVS